MKHGPVWVLLLSWLPLLWISSQGHGSPAQAVAEPVASVPMAEPVASVDAPTISTAPLRIGGGPRPDVLRPKQVRLVLRSEGGGAVAIYHDRQLLGRIVEGADGKYSGGGFAVLMDRSTFWIKSEIEIAREPEVPRLALEAVSHALLTGGALEQRFSVLEPSPR